MHVDIVIFFHQISVEYLFLVALYIQHSFELHMTMPKVIDF